MRDPLARLDLGKVLTFYGVQYRQTGGWHNVLCPVHDERSPDCGVNLDAGKIFCHACGFRGDGYDLIMEKEGIGLAEATDLADQEGFVASNSDVRGGPPRKSRGSLPSRSGNRGPDDRAHDARLRRPGRPA